MPEIPDGIETFVLVGIGLVILAVPVRVVYEMTRGSRDRTRRLRDLADRLRGRFDSVRMESTFLGPPHLRLVHEGRPAVLFLPAEDAVAVRLDPGPDPIVRAIFRSRRPVRPPWAFAAEGWRVLGRVPSAEPLVDEAADIYADAAAAATIRELLTDGAPESAAPSPLVESLVVLSRLPGVRDFRLKISPRGDSRALFRLRTEDLIHRPDEMESAVHHAFRLHDLLGGGA
ncbi:MAG TPA: hypothetical protein VNO22_06185 [Planctomycetota bacterium]|nr:hypothetical protein [Planctomycetota bacterium]